MTQRRVRTTSQERSTARQQSLVDAAASLLIRVGPAAITHRRVAAEAGVPAGSANYYFPSKSVLFVAAVRRAEEMRSASAAELASAVPVRTRSAIETARLMIEIFFAPQLTSDVLAVRLEPMLAAHGDPELRQIIADFRPLHLDAQRVVLRRSGYETIADGPDVELLARMIESSLLYAGQTGDADPIDAASRSVARLIELAQNAADVAATDG